MIVARTTGTVRVVFPVGGVGAMLLGSAVSGVVCLVLALVLRRRLGWVSALALGGFLWTLAVIAAVTLLPMYARTGFIPADEAQTMCSFDIGGPAPDGFWILGGTQRLLNTLAFIPPAACLTVFLARWRWWALVTVPFGIAFLMGYSFLIEITQLELARLDRACDVTDIIDNASGVVFGAVIGVLLVVLLRPWRERSQRSTGGRLPPTRSPHGT